MRQLTGPMTSVPLTLPEPYETENGLRVSLPHVRGIFFVSCAPPYIQRNNRHFNTRNLRRKRNVERRNKLTHVLDDPVSMIREYVDSQILMSATYVTSRFVTVPLPWRFSLSDKS